MNIPSPMVHDDPNDSRRGTLVFQGAVSVALDVSAQLACKYEKEITNYKTEEWKLRDHQPRDFGFEVLNPH